MWLAYLAKYLEEPIFPYALIATIAGSLGILTKATTFPAFAVLGALLFIKKCHTAWVAGVAIVRARSILLALLVIAVPFAIGIGWTIYSDMVKAKNELGIHLTSVALARWNFGTIDQRLSAMLWRDVIWNRTLTDIFGYSAIPAVALIAVSVISRRYAYVALAVIGAFLVPFLVFTNLHIIHNYYQTANGIFIIAAAGLGLAAVMSARQIFLATVCFAILLAGQLAYFHAAYAALLTDDFSQEPVFRAAHIARAATQPGASLIVIGDDWSSRVPYYAQRKSFAIPNWMPVTSWQRILAAPQRFLDGAPLGAVVYCADTAPQDSERKSIINSFVSGRAVIGESGRCKVLAP